MEYCVARMQRQAGFTLIELMLVVALVAILAMIAQPAYQGAIVKSSRAAAKSYLMDAAQMQHQYYNDARRFASSLEQLNKTQPVNVSSNYWVAVAADPNEIPPSFTITATPLPGTRQFDDGVLSIDHTGRKLRATAEAEIIW